MLFILPIVMMLLSIIVFNKFPYTIKIIHNLVVILAVTITLVIDVYLLFRGGQSSIGVFYLSFVVGVVYLLFIAVLLVIYAVNKALGSNLPR